jgi:hypothetical protein
MITYIYWLCVAGLCAAAIYLLGIKGSSWKAAIISAAVILAVGWGAYYFRLQQTFVKRWGGVMNISVPEGQQHITATWKADNLWVENYDPATNICTFSEYSRGNVLEGRVKIKNCNPVHAQPPQAVRMP